MKDKNKYFFFGLFLVARKYIVGKRVESMNFTLIYKKQTRQMFVYPHKITARTAKRFILPNCFICTH